MSELDDQNEPRQSPSDGGSPTLMREQRSGGVSVTWDGDGYARVWEPNADPTSDARIDVDLRDSVAALIDLGRSAPPAPEPHWTDRTGLTLIVAMSAGSEGFVTIDGSAVSEAAATRLLANGFVECLRRSVAERPARSW